MKKFKAEIIVRTDEFCHIAPQVEGTLEEIVGVHDELKNMLADKEGLNTLEWAKFRNKFLWTGGQMPPEMQDLNERLNRKQQVVINELKLALRAAKPEGEVDELQAQEDHIKSIT